MNKKIGFFGGCFNPPSNIHIELAKKLLEENKIDKVVFVPVGDFYEKENLESAKHRYNMLKLAVQNNRNLEVEDIELNINKKLYATDIFKIIKEKYKDDDIYFIMGSDNYCKMPSWKNYQEIKDKYNYIILERNYKEIDSTKIRQKISKNLSVEDLISKKVYEYIKKYNLYKF